MNNIEYAYDKGYRILKDGTVIGLNGNIRKQDKDNKGYKRFSIQIEKKVKCFRSARLQAYQKYGSKMFEKGIQVRHLNGNPMDNSWDNISIGTASENQMDRQKQAEHAASFIHRFTDNDIRNIRKDRKSGMIMRLIGEKYKTSKGHICDIINGKLYKNVI